MAHGESSGYFDGLPDARTSLRGLNLEGDEVWMIRGLSQKLYTCPGCRGRVEIGAAHTIVQQIARIGGSRHTHWHTDCATDRVLLGLRQVREVSANDSRPDRLAGRASRPAGRRDRRGRRGGR